MTAQPASVEESVSTTAQVVTEQVVQAAASNHRYLSVLKLIVLTILSGSGRVWEE
jgi:hypothetical protein